MLQNIFGWFTNAFIIVLILILALIFFLAFLSVLRKLKNDGFKSVDKWNEIQALTNLGVIISFFFVILNFFDQKNDSEANKKLYENQLIREDQMFDKGHEINLVNYEYYKWEKSYDEKNDQLNIWAHKTDENLNFNCFDLQIKPIFENKKSKEIISTEVVNPVNLTYSCVDNNVKLNYENSQIMITINELKKSAYNYFPNSTEQVNWLDRAKHNIIGYYLELSYYPSLARNNECKIEGLCLNNKKSIFSNINWK